MRSAKLGWLIGAAALALLLAGCTGQFERYVEAQELPEDTVTILTPALKTGAPLYVDFDHDGVHDPEELIGYYDVYDWNQELTVAWLPDAMEAADPQHTAYRVSIFQVRFEDILLAIFGLVGPEVFHELKVAHHAASDPNPNRFTFGSFGYGETVCFADCISAIVVIPETVELVHNSATDTYEYVYTIPPDAIPQISNVFVFEQTPR